MNIKKLKDITTDNTMDMNYGLSEDNFEVDDSYHKETGEPTGKMLFIYFDNKLNEESINA